MIMHFSRKTLEMIEKLSKDDEFGPFFDRLGRRDPNMPTELFDKIALAFTVELGVHSDKAEKLRFLMELGYVVGAPREQTDLE